MIHNRTCFKSYNSLYNLAANTNRAIKRYQGDNLPKNDSGAQALQSQQTTRNKRHLTAILKIAGYAAVIVLSGMDATWAGLDEQVGKASDLILGNVAAMILGGGVVFGGATAALKGNLMQAMAIIGTGGIIGIGTALAKNGQIFSILN